VNRIQGEKGHGQDFTMSCSYTNRVRWANYTPSGCKFPIVYTCQKLCKLSDSIQSYSKHKKGARFFETQCSCISNSGAFDCSEVVMCDSVNGFM